MSSLYVSFASFMSLGAVHFVVLSSEHDSGDMFEWLESDLRVTTDAPDLESTLPLSNSSLERCDRYRTGFSSPVLSD